MTFSVTSDDGVYLGTAEAVSYELRRPEFGLPDSSLRSNTVRSTPKEITLECFHPSTRTSDLEFKVQALENDRDFYRDLFNRVVAQRNEHVALARQRGKTIHELTEKFREKKERIHAFYAPQLENRKLENEELEDWQDTADYWMRACMAAERRERTLRERPAAEPVHDSVIQEHEEQIGKLSRERDQWRGAHRAASERNVEWAGENQNLRGELAVVKAERDRLLTRINCFMEEFGEAVTQINNAVEDWNDEEEGA